MSRRNRCRPRPWLTAAPRPIRPFRFPRPAPAHRRIPHAQTMTSPDHDLTRRSDAIDRLTSWRRDATPFPPSHRSPIAAPTRDETPTDYLDRGKKNLTTKGLVDNGSGEQGRDLPDGPRRQSAFDPAAVLLTSVRQTESARKSASETVQNRRQSESPEVRNRRHLRKQEAQAGLVRRRA